MILAGEKAGNPWHGEWTPDGLELPNSTVLELDNPPEGDAAACPDWSLVNNDPRPEGSPWPSFGDCFVIKFPDQPAVETSEAETAAGMEWLNYALFSGATHSLYDVKLGRDYFVYIDDDGTPWLTRISRSSSNARITLKRNFEFGGVSETFTVDIAMGFYSSGSYNFYVLDASETGRALTIGAINLTTGLLFPMMYSTVYALMLGGIPGDDFSGSFSAPYSDNGHTWVVTNLPGNPTEHSEGTEYRLEEVTRIYDGDAAIAVKVGWSFDVSALTWNFESETWDPFTSEGYLRIVTDFGEVQIPATVTRTWGTSDYSVWSDDVEVGSYSYTHAYNDTETRGDWWGSMPALIAWRRSNKVIEIAFSTIDAMPLTETEVHSICLVMPDRFQTTNTIISQNNADRYFSYHPVKHDLLESSDPVCFM